MPTYKDYGIVLNSFKLAEKDKILNIYTKENGLVRAIAKGSRNPTNKFFGKIDQLSCCYFQFARGRNLDVISDCEQVSSFPLLRKDLTRLTHGILFLEIVSNFAHELESESQHVYDLLYLSLEGLQATPNINLLTIKFIVDFLSVHGYKPQLETCVSCSKDVSIRKVKLPYSSALGGVLCNECAGSIDHKLINCQVLEIIRTDQNVYPENKHVNENIRLALDLLREHIDIRAKNKIRTFDLVFSL